MEKSDAQLAEFLSAVERVRRERMGGLDEAARKKIAQELGWSEADLQAARAAGEAKREKGRAFLEHGVFGEALTCLLEAEALLPDDPIVAMLLAEVHARARRLPLARAAALRALEIDPKHEKAFALLAELERRAASRKRLRLYAALSVVIIVVGAALVRSQPAPPPSTETLKPPPVIAKKASTHWHDGKLACASGRSDCIVKVIPVVKGELSAIVLSFDDASGLKTDYDGPKVIVAGRVEVAKGSEVEELTVDLVQLDADDHEIDRIPMRVFPSYEPRLRAGDTYVFHHGERAKPGVETVQFVVTTARVSAAPAKYEPVTPLALTTAKGLPTHFMLTSTLLSIESKAYDERSSLKGVIDVTNAGPNPVHALVVTVECLDPSGRVAGTSDETIAYHHMPPMRAGERRKASFSCYVRSKLQDTPRLVVKEID